MAPMDFLMRATFGHKSHLSGGLDIERRKIIAALILNYTGW